MKQETGIFLKGVDVPPDVNRIMGHDSDGYYILERVTIHTDGTPDEWVRTYYNPCPTSDGMDVSQVIVDEWMGSTSIYCKETSGERFFRVYGRTRRRSGSDFGAYEHIL